MIVAVMGKRFKIGSSNGSNHDLEDCRSVLSSGSGKQTNK